MSRTKPDLPRFTQFAVEHFSDAAYLIEEDGRIAYVNEAACRILGYTRAELLELAMYDINRDLTKETWPAVWKALKTMGKRTFEARHIAKDGRSIAVEISANLMSFDGMEYSCAFARDIEERRELEVRLRQAEKMEAVGVLAGGIAHDFNNQLAGIMGYAELLRRRVAADRDLASLAHNILIAVNRAADLTSQLLAFSRQGKYVTEPVDVHKLVVEVTDMLALKVDPRIRIEKRLDAQRSMVLGDPAQLGSVILNLALNAADAMPDGGQLTFVTANRQLDESFASTTTFRVTADDHVQLAVIDTGTGIDEDTQRRMFEPFFTTKPAGKGTGLGLAAVYGTVKNHKGAITVDSTLGHGARFDVFLPVLTGMPAASLVRPPVQTAVPTGRHVMVVEDDPVVREVVVKTLESLGCRVTAFDDGKAAVAFYERTAEEVDLVLLDMVMPVLNGRETFRALRAIDPRVRALVASGYSLEGEAQSLREDGVLGFIQKPYSIDTLAAKLADVFAMPTGVRTRTDR